MESIKHRLSKVYEFAPDVIDEMYDDLICTLSQNPDLSERLTILSDWLDYQSNFFTLIWLMLNGATEILFTENS